MGGASLKVLLVEDEPLIALTLVDLLEELGHQALEALNGAQAVELFGQHPDIDLLITDLGLPDISGDRLADRLRTNAPSLPVIFATAPSGARLPRRMRMWPVGLIGSATPSSPSVTPSTATNTTVCPARRSSSGVLAESHLPGHLEDPILRASKTGRSVR